ncbi:MAG TPA: LL-diaminopimelate aminotransferase [Ktedonobacterales bacterium]|nr:LL-diaminopimelate aminotransferase [Ktedonobacterales bacterium]
MRLSQRLTSLPPYHFAAYNQTIAELRASGVDIINLSMGDPDLPTPPAVLDALTERAQEPINQRYPDYAGMLELRAGFARWFAGRFGVELDPAREVAVLIGSKEGLAHLPMAVMDPGDVALMPNPAYPVYPTAVALAGGVCYDLPLDAAHGWLPDLSAIPAETVSRARTLWLNYPNNPTGAAATAEFFAEAVAFAHRHDILIVHDMAYAEVRYDGARPASILETPGAKEVAVEFHSFSKAYNMAGFRLGMLVGNATIVEGMVRFKSNIDTGVFRPIQYAAMRALELPETWLAERNAIYQRRRDRLAAACRRLGMATELPEAGLYLWPRLPAGQPNEPGASSAFALRLLRETGVAVTPGTNFGTEGEGYLRISLTVPDARLDEAIARLAGSVG